MAGYKTNLPFRAVKEIIALEKYTIKDGDIILSVNSGEIYADELSQNLYFKLVNTSVTGHYHDILTFVTNIV